MSTNELYERFFDLRNAQSNCTPAERAKIQEEIKKIQAEIDKRERN